MKCSELILLLTFFSSSLLADSSFVGTEIVDWKKVDGWRITAETSMGQTSCRAVGSDSRWDITILYSPESKYRKHNWYLGATVSQNLNPEDQGAVPAEVVGKKGAVLGRGKLVTVSSSSPGEASISKTRFEFLTNNSGVLSQSSGLKIQSKVVKSKIPLLPALRAIVEELINCHKSPQNKFKDSK